MKKIIVKNETGIHARPASLVVAEAQKYKEDIKIVKEGKKVSLKSIMGLMSLGIKKDTEIEIYAEGPNAEEVEEKIATFIENLEE